MNDKSSILGIWIVAAFGLIVFWAFLFQMVD